jgi:uncharacterized protein involved in exopolysaccharide biosynthesis
MGLALMRDILKVVWKWKVRLILVWVVVIFFVLLRVLGMDVIYTSSCLLTPLALEQVEEGGGGALGGGSPIRTILGGGGVRDDYAVAAFMQSRQLTLGVVEELNLERELFARRWDAQEEDWIEASEGRPTSGEILRSMAARVDVRYDDFTGLLLLEIHWWSAERAREIADAFVEVGDRMLRDSAIAEGERRVSELRQEMENVTVGEVGVFLAEEMTRAISLLTSIRARSRYAFRVIDPPIVPHKKSWPPRTFLMLVAGFALAVIELGFVAGVHLRGQARSSEAPDH